MSNLSQAREVPGQCTQECMTRMRNDRLFARSTAIDGDMDKMASRAISPQAFQGRFQLQGVPGVKMASSTARRSVWETLTNLPREWNQSVPGYMTAATTPPRAAR